MSRRTLAADAGGGLTEGTGLGGVPLLSFEADSPDKPPQKTRRLFNIYCFLFLKIACREMRDIWASANVSFSAAVRYAIFLAICVRYR
jgi:hypothetical protein